MSKIIIYISFIVVVSSFLEFFYQGNNLIIKDSSGIEIVDAFEDNSSADEEDDKELFCYGFFPPHYTIQYGLTSNSDFTYLFDLHSPPPEL
jgi:hypothetical protein